MRPGTRSLWCPRGEIASPSDVIFQSHLPLPIHLEVTSRIEYITRFVGFNNYVGNGVHALFQALEYHTNA
jgi:hypothetical protein